MEVFEIDGAPVVARPHWRCARCGGPADNVIEWDNTLTGVREDVIACDAHVLEVSEELLRTRTDATPMERTAILDSVDVWNQRQGLR